MTPVGIVLLIAGIVAIVASFFVPDTQTRDDKKDIEKKQEQIRRLLESELDGMKLRVNEATNETVESSMEKSERALEKITNDKIMAVSEYASTVMEEIDRNHKEVMFLYDMLNDKQTDVKNSLRHAEATVKEVNEAVKTASDTAIYATNVANAANETANAVNEAVSTANVTDAFENSLYEMMQSSLSSVMGSVSSPVPVAEETKVVKPEIPQESVFTMAANMDDFNFADVRELAEPEISKVLPKVEEVKQEIEKEPTEFELLERSTSFANVNNNNQMILKLNAQGMSVVDIARQLSLGVGEVQLVIDLFK